MSDNIAFRVCAPVSLYNNPFDNMDEAVVDKINKVAKKSMESVEWNKYKTAFHS